MKIKICALKKLSGTCEHSQGCNCVDKIKSVLYKLRLAMDRTESCKEDLVIKDVRKVMRQSIDLLKSSKYDHRTEVDSDVKLLQGKVNEFETEHRRVNHLLIQREAEIEELKKQIEFKNRVIADLRERHNDRSPF